MQTQTGKVPALSTRAVSILELLVQGRKNKEIAVTLGISPHTVRNELRVLYARLGVEDRLQAGLLATSLGLVKREPVSD